jgi:hypothetical protein
VRGWRKMKNLKFKKVNEKLAVIEKNSMGFDVLVTCEVEIDGVLLLGYINIPFATAHIANICLNNLKGGTK